MFSIVYFFIKVSLILEYILITFFLINTVHWKLENNPPSKTGEKKF